MSATTGPAMLSCQELIDFLDDYVEEGLSASERERFEEHLAVCVDCRRYLKGYRGTLQVLQHAARSNDAVPDEVPRQLVEAILAARRAARPTPSPTDRDDAR